MGIYGVHSCTADNHELNITLKGYRAIGNEQGHRKHRETEGGSMVGEQIGLNHDGEIDGVSRA